MSRLLERSYQEVVPFLIIFIMYTIYNGMIYHIFGMYPNYFNEKDPNFADDFANIGTLGYFFISLGNGIGDFRPPTFEKHTSPWIIGAMYLFWLLQML